MRKIFELTPKSFLQDLPRFSFKGNIVLVISSNETNRACQFLEKQNILGIDTETKPRFKKGPMNKPALLQISTKDICFLFRINKRPLQPCLVNILSDPNIIKVGLSLKDDMAALHKLTDFEPMGWIDLQDKVKNIGVRDQGLQRLFANLFHKRISKSKQRSNWEADVLTEAQKIYAATDAYACLLLYEEIQKLQNTQNYEIIPTSVEEHDNENPNLTTTI